jgi:hypothetical protein
MFHIFIGMTAALVMAGCAPMVNTPVMSRTTNPDVFILLKAGRIDPTKTQAVADCLHDGFAGSHGVFTNITARMNRRAGGYRVETATGGTIVVISADVMDDGVVELRESKHAALISTKGERDVFQACTANLLIPTSK